MNIPNLPTDNLYKFIAIAGIIIAIFPCFLLYNNVQELLIQAINNQTEVNVLNIETDYLNKELKHLENQTTILENDMQKKGLEKEEVIFLHDETQKLYETHKEIELKTKELKIKLEQTKNKDELHKFLVEQYRKFRFLTYILIFLGSFLSVCGFYCWYRKLQVYQDKFFKEMKNGKTL